MENKKIKQNRNRKSKVYVWENFISRYQKVKNHFQYEFNIFGWQSKLRRFKYLPRKKYRLSREKQACNAVLVSRDFWIQYNVSSFNILLNLKQVKTSVQQLQIILIIFNYLKKLDTTFSTWIEFQSIRERNPKSAWSWSLAFSRGINIRKEEVRSSGIESWTDR